MHDTNQPFWEEFKAMMADPVQRKELMQYFDELKATYSEKPKQQIIKIAVVGTSNDFEAFKEYLYTKSRDLVKELYPGCLIVGQLEFQMVRGEIEAYGVKFDAFINRASHSNQQAIDAASYLAAHNTKVLHQYDFLQMIKLHVPNPIEQ